MLQISEAFQLVSSKKQPQLLFSTSTQRSFCGPQFIGVALPRVGMQTLQFSSKLEVLYWEEVLVSHARGRNYITIECYAIMNYILAKSHHENSFEVFFKGSL